MTGRKIDDETLADAYNAALALEKAGQIDAAVEAYTRVLALDPSDHGGVAVRLAALRRGEVPAKAPDAYVATLFDQHAEDFEDILVDALGYGVPGLARDRLDALGLGPFQRVLDLGCGTGLMAEALGERAGEIVGLDLSEAMVDMAFDKDIYDGLYVAEAVEFLQDNDEPAFDLIAAADVLPYVGALDALFAGMAANLNPGGIIAFSSETDETADAGFAVTPHQRFAHAQDYVAAQLQSHGFELVEATDINVRMQDGKPTPGQLIVARRG